jgi:hypothetical protein
VTRRVAIALVHHPVLDGKGAVVTTAITNLDVHDLARSARTYGVSDYFLVHPIAVQRELVQRICDHWRDGSSGKRIPDRKLALELVRPVASLDEVFEAFGGRGGVKVWVTAARDLRRRSPRAGPRGQELGLQPPERARGVRDHPRPAPRLHLR